MKKQSLILSSYVIIFFFIFYFSLVKSSEKEIKFVYGDTRIGEVKVVDGDTIVLNGKKIRFLGIDAPELKQLCKKKNSQKYKCGEESKKFLKYLSREAKKITCYYEDFDRYGRILGICGYVHNTDFSALMLEHGHAVIYKNYSGWESENYKYWENVAKGNKFGVWQGDFDMPWIWRKKNK